MKGNYPNFNVQALEFIRQGELLCQKGPQIKAQVENSKGCVKHNN